MLFKTFHMPAALAVLIASASASKVDDRGLERRQTEGFCAERTNTCWDSSSELGDCEKGDCTNDNNKCTLVRSCGGMSFYDTWVECE